MDIKQYNFINFSRLTLQGVASKNSYLIHFHAGIQKTRNFWNVLPVGFSTKTRSLTAAPLATLGHDFTPSYPKTESLPLAIPHSKGRNYPFPLAGVNGPSHSYTQLLDIMIVQFRNEKVSNYGSIPITIDCNVVNENENDENREQRQSRFGPIRRIYALLDDRFDELPYQTENKSLDSY
ncbi:hypothetical protein TNCV_5111341 [Trichonephila clavipes]|nr:hypothetical protein TNCV_5111341 [Trichonephila clavipes]